MLCYLSVLNDYFLNETDLFLDGFSPKITFVVVKKRISARFFSPSHNQMHNPSPGTVVDDVCTKKEW